MVKYCQFWKDCHQRAIVRLKYSGITVCKEHFIKNIEARVEKALTHYHMKEPGPIHWLVPMTGSAASQVLLEILSKLSLKAADTRSPLTLTAAYVDLGISSTSSKDLVLATCARHNITCHVLDLKAEYGLDAADITSLCPSTIDPYTAAEALKYQLLAKKALELGATRIATEITLVDEATTLFRKFLGMDVCDLAREHSWERSKSVSAGLPLRVRPLIEVSDEEVAFYARISDVKFEENSEVCPRKYDPVRKHLLEIELDRGGNMLTIVRRFHKVFMPLIEKVGEGDKGEECLGEEEKWGCEQDRMLLESLVPLNDAEGDENQVAVCKRCKLMGDVGEGEGLCRACWVLEAMKKRKDGGDGDEVVKKKDERPVVPSVSCVMKDVGNENGEEYKFFISTDVRGIRAKRKDRLKEEQEKGK